MGPSPVIDVLLDVRSLLARPRGWTKGKLRRQLGDGTWAFCVMGAIEESGAGIFDALRARRRLEGAVGASVEAFNDRPNTELADVLAAIDRAISAEWYGDPAGAQGVEGLPRSATELLAYLDAGGHLDEFESSLRWVRGLRSAQCQGPMRREEPPLSGVRTSP
jgi:hypothetical protein